MDANIDDDQFGIAEVCDALEKFSFLRHLEHILRRIEKFISGHLLNLPVSNI